MTAKSEWDKVALALANANSKAINAIFCSVSTDEFHRILYMETAKEAWTILKTTYVGTKKVKDTKLQMLTTRCCEILKYSQVYEPYRSIVGQERGRTHRDLYEHRKIN